MRLVFATRNAGKLRELRELLVTLPAIEIFSLDDFPKAPEALPETGETFAENAQQKAVAALHATGLAALADDSGLEVAALGGRPGIHSARYAGPAATDADRVAKLLRELADVPEAERVARFRCVIALVTPERPDVAELREGCCEGTILRAPRGDQGFGYDPVFFVPALGRTFAEVSGAEKHRHSHRGHAMQAIAALLRQRCGRRPEPPAGG
ncbi:MAG: XTP/dITP diphosphatase [Proteobacteria bacterium]|nr:XTP/dITP diphosphatase [Pseudomonadota bacterium]